MRCNDEKKKKWRVLALRQMKRIICVREKSVYSGSIEEVFPSQNIQNRSSITITCWRRVITYTSASRNRPTKTTFVRIHSYRRASSTCKRTARVRFVNVKRNASDSKFGHSRKILPCRLYHTARRTRIRFVGGALNTGRLYYTGERAGDDLTPPSNVWECTYTRDDAGTNTERNLDGFCRRVSNKRPVDSVFSLGESIFHAFHFACCRLWAERRRRETSHHST